MQPYIAYKYQNEADALRAYEQFVELMKQQPEWDVSCMRFHIPRPSVSWYIVILGEVLESSELRTMLEERVSQIQPVGERSSVDNDTITVFYQRRAERTKNLTGFREIHYRPGLPVYVRGTANE